MELKLQNSIVFKYFHMSFNRTAYGIETCKGVACDVQEIKLLIAPLMELKRGRVYQKHPV